MNPLLLIALLGGGAIVASKLLKRCETPPDNPFISSDGADIAWKRVFDQMQVHPDYMISANDKRAMGYVVAGLSAANPAFGAAASLVVQGLVKIDQLTAEDENGQKYKDMLNSAYKDCLSRGFLPPMPDPNYTLAENLRHMSAPPPLTANAPTYSEWLTLQGGEMFKKWGGVANVLALGSTFLVGDNRFLGSYPAILMGDTLEVAAQKNEPRLALAATAIAYEYCVQKDAAKVIGAAVYACQNHLAFAAQQRFSDYGILFNPQGSVHLAYELGIYAALSTAARLAGKPQPPPLTPKTYNLSVDRLFSDPSTPTKNAPAISVTPRLQIPTPIQASITLENLPEHVKAELSSGARDTYKTDALAAYHGSDVGKIVQWTKDLRARGYDTAAATMSQKAQELGYKGSDLFVPDPARARLTVDELPEKYNGDDYFRETYRNFLYVNNGNPAMVANGVIALHRMGFDAAAYQLLPFARKIYRAGGVENLSPR